MNDKCSRLCVVVGIFGLLISGCVREESDGDAIVITYELWVSLAAFFGGIAAAVGGWFLREKSSRFGWAMIIGGALSTIMFSPSLLRERSIVRADSLSNRSGIWGLTSVHDVGFDDVRQVRLTSRVTRGRRGRERTSYYLIFERNSEGAVEVPVNNDVTRASLPHILGRLSERNIPLVDETE